MGQREPHSACTEQGALQANVTAHFPLTHLPMQQSESEEQDALLLTETQQAPVGAPAARLHASPVPQHEGMVPFAAHTAPNVRLHEAA